MGQTTRHFNALMRKNLINWKREPCSAVCQVLCPGFLMLIIVYMRTRVTPTIGNTEFLQLFTQPFYQVSTTGGTIDIAATDAKVTGFFDYTNHWPVSLFGPYQPSLDPTSPLNFNPPSCLLENSFVLPKVAANMIAVVGPNSTVSENILSYLETLQTYWSANKINNLSLTYFEDLTSFNNYVGGQTYLQPDQGICFGFQVTNTSNSAFQINLLVDDQQQFGGSTGASIPFLNAPAWTPAASNPDIKAFNQSAQNGYSFIQNIVANEVLKVTTGVQTASIEIMASPVPSDKLIIDQFQTVLSSFLPLFLLLMYILPVYNITQQIVKEKESKTKESMRMMGMTDTSYWLSWFAYYTLINTIISLVGWLCLCINVIQYGPPVYIFLYMWLFGEATFGQIVFLQSLFSRAKFAGLVAALIFFGCSLIFIPVSSLTSPRSAKTLASIFPQVASSNIAVVFAQFETNQIGINSVTAHEVYGDYTFDTGLWMFLVSFIVFVLLGLYLDQVLPKEFGQRKHPCFMFMPSTYTDCCRRRPQPQVDDNERERRSTLLSKEKNGGGMEVRNLKPENYEPVAAEIARQEVEGQYLRIEGLEKTYDNDFQAVRGLNLKIYKNQIFALLGQNGAGKTTTISMLTGLLPSTKGSATAFDIDMFNDADQVRQFMGVCPQHDILFDFLTPIEHLSVFYDFKGGNPALKQKEIDDLIRDVGLTTDKDKPAASLSGGNKRKLSVAIALCGGSKLVLLDEPTAGMDLGARRGLWDMLKNYRRDKIIILTTHYMDEADVLGDRIGIMAKGQMMCLGTSLFLKNRFGAGYKLTMVKANKQANLVIGSYLKTHLGEVELLSEVSSEIVFQVTSEAAKKFKQFFQTFDQELNRLGITSYGVSITTLEEVFLKINKEFNINIDNAAIEDRITVQGGFIQGEIPDASKEFEANGENRESITSINKRLQLVSGQTSGDLEDVVVDEPQRLVGNGTVSMTVQGLLGKRWNIYKRDRTGLCCEVLVPLVMVIFGSLLTKIDIVKKSTATEVTPQLYPAPQRIMFNQDNVLATPNPVTPETLYTNLPSSASFFEVTYNSTASNYSQFYNAVYNARNVGPSTPYRYGSYQVYQADDVLQTYQITSFLNLTSPFVTEYYPQYIYESILKSATGNPNFQYQLTTQPFPTLVVLSERGTSGNAFNYSFMVSIGLALIPCVMISFILREREDSLKHIQLISGMSLPAYWISNMVADLIKVYIPIILMVLISKIFQVNFAGVWILYLLLPLALVPFTYITSFLFKNDTTAQIVTLFLNFFICAVMGVVVFFLQLVPTTQKLGTALRWIFCILPNYCLINGILWSSSGYLIIAVEPQYSAKLWAWSNLGGDAAILLAHFVIDTLILIMIEADWLNCLKNYSLRKIPPIQQQLADDDDVIREKQRVASNTNDVIRVADLRKAYTTFLGDPFVAVEDISFGLNYGECFALLGVNGAGKSTTFKSLTADTEPTTGQITIAGFNIQTQFGDARKLIGYCPQKDAIFPLMTVEEHLVFYAKIKGIPENLQQRIVQCAITDLNLSDHRNKPSGTLSGGNKRKLSVAIATLGNPPIILLDEPSAGMDPEARRFMWSVVAGISQRDKKCAVVLTTHSMEEAEALSTKMGIMVRGGIFKCFGSSQHIKNKFGTGYELEIKIRKPAYAELEERASSMKFAQSIEQRVGLNEAMNFARSFGVDPIILSQVKEGGIGSDLFFEAQLGEGTIRLKNFVTYLFTQHMGLQVITVLTKQFKQVDLIEQCSDYFKFRVPREDKTIGYLFGLIEDNKTQLKISEYSVCQTSLEQIFQAFANQSINEKASLSFSIDGLEQLRIIESRKSEAKNNY